VGWAVGWGKAELAGWEEEATGSEEEATGSEATAGWAAGLGKEAVEKDSASMRNSRSL